MTATITCPHCGHAAKEKVPAALCLIVYMCNGCGRQLQPKEGDCCVFCSYGDRRCPTKLEENEREDNSYRP